MSLHVDQPDVLFPFFMLSHFNFKSKNSQICLRGLNSLYNMQIIVSLDPQTLLYCIHWDWQEMKTDLHRSPPLFTLIQDTDKSHLEEVKAEMFVRSGKVHLHKCSVTSCLYVQDQELPSWSTFTKEGRITNCNNCKSGQRKYFSVCFVVVVVVVVVASRHIKHIPLVPLYSKSSSFPPTGLLLISVSFLIVRGTSSPQSNGCKCSPAAGHSQARRWGKSYLHISVGCDSAQRLIRYMGSELVEPSSACSCMSSSQLKCRNLEWNCHNSCLMIHFTALLSQDLRGRFCALTEF